MRLYKTETEFNCGIDLHSKCMYACVMDRDGKILVHRNIQRNDFEYFLKLVSDYKHDLTVCAECTFKRERWQDLHVLLSVPGIGKVLALTILYEIGEISRFRRHQDFASYARLVKGTVASAGKIAGTRGAKMGNGYLKWAFKECILVAKRSHPEIKAMAQRLEVKHDRATANAILAHRMARAIYYMLSHGVAFSMELFSKRIRNAA